VALVALAVAALEPADRRVRLRLMGAGVAPHAVGRAGRTGPRRRERGERGVAIEAADPRVRPRGELEAGVVPGEPRPLEASGKVAALAVRAEAGAGVIDRRPRRACVVHLVASEAVGGGAREPPVALVLVALLAGDGGVAAGQGEVREPVRVGAELRRPTGRIVARGAAVAELAGVHVLVAGAAAGRDRGAEVRGRSVAGAAGGGDVASLERETGAGVIEGHRRPPCRRMASLAAGLDRDVPGRLHPRRWRGRGDQRERHEEKTHGLNPPVNPRNAPRCTSKWQPAQVVGMPR